MSKIPSPEELRKRLSAGHFGKSRKSEPGDPVQPTPMVVPVTKIDLYDHNPRAVENEKYEEIKESIRRSGLEQPISITRRPGSENYMVDAGGNTRLRILKELHQEHPHDPRFFNIHVLYQPWVSESHVLAKHLKENDLRGSLAFIDRARGVMKMRELLEQELGEPISSRKLATILTEQGYKIDSGNLSRLEYAATVLLPLIPLALEAGLGAPKVRRIRRIENALEKYLEFLGHEDREGPVALWRECLAEVDTADEDLPIDRAYENLARRLEPVLRYANAQSILIDLDMLMEGKTIRRYEPSPEVDGNGEKSLEGGSAGPAPGGEAEPARRAPPAAPAGGDEPGGPGARAAPDTDEGGIAGGRPGAGDAGQAGGRDEKPVRHPLPDDARSLQARLWIQAIRLTRPLGLEPLLRKTRSGAGYFIDVPETPFSSWRTGNPLGDTPEEEHRTGVWWLLMELAEQPMAAKSEEIDGDVHLVAPEEILDTRWMQRLAHDRNMDDLVGTPYHQLGITLRQISPEELQIVTDMLAAKKKLATLLGNPASIWIPGVEWAGKPGRDDR